VSEAQTPSQKIIEAAAQTEDITDSLGRVLTVQRTTKLEMRRLTRVCGPAADIDRWFGEAMLAVQVRAIDGAKMMFPISAETTDALVARVDNEGLLAVQEWAMRGMEVPQENPQT